jgi:hypothetical protein
MTVFNGTHYQAKAILSNRYPTRLEITGGGSSAEAIILGNRADTLIDRLNNGEELDAIAAEIRPSW